ncbi:MarR family winged helix-turn-helix transcriptional regulator [Rhodoligotrophos defluvii]|uniref:MarR family winged helix-turn-helix transcriptional regulator n=1 Tax=Rhodoligotrophos defluvii TaxID=2561934 RepID=UPI0014854243|nr:MarR family transcriptional regulator [Rhodoligotrophos defluvii]
MSVQEQPRRRQTRKAKEPADGHDAAPSRRDLQRGLELHFFAHLNLAEDANRQLAALDMGRTHHRILYFTVQTPGITVGELTSLLRVTHQAIQRPMGDLVRGGYIQQQMSSVDRRQRQLFSTPKGLALFEQLSQRQFERLARAYEKAGSEAVMGFWAVLSAMVEPADHEWIRRGEQARAAPAAGHAKKAK